MTDFKRASEILYAGEHVKGMDLKKPETLPIFETTAFTMNSLSELAEVTAEKGWTYSRTRNPNRAALAEAISYLEGGEASLIFASGMGSITVPMITLLQPGDRVLCNANIYGETFSTLRDILSKMGVETDFVDYLDMDAVRAAIRPEPRGHNVLALIDLRGKRAGGDPAFGLAGPVEEHLRVGRSHL